jgi:hypothetical protein
MFILFFFENRVFYETMWRNTVQPGSSEMTILRMRIAFLIPKATSRHSEYVIRIAFPPQKWLHECASLLRHTYVACLYTPFVNHKCLSELHVIFTENSYVT